jgi:hypothetical protein
MTREVDGFALLLLAIWTVFAVVPLYTITFASLAGVIDREPVIHPLGLVALSPIFLMPSVFFFEEIRTWRKNEA